MRLDDFEKQISIMLDDRKKKITDLTEKIEAAEKAKTAAHGKSIERFNNEDVAGYHKALDELRSADDTKRLYEGKLNELTSTPAINERDYLNAVSAIKAAIGEIVDAERLKVVALIDQMTEHSNTAADAIEKGNRLLHTLQWDLRLDDTTVRGPGGEFPQSHRDKKFDDFSLIRFVENCKASPVYRKEDA